MSKESARSTPETLSAPQLFDTAVVIGNTTNQSGEEPSLDKATTNAMWAAVFLKNANLTNDIVGISSVAGTDLMSRLTKSAGVKKPIIRIEAEEDKKTEQLLKIIEEGKLGNVALISPEGGSSEIYDELKRKGLHAETIVPDEEIGRRMVDSASLEHLFRFLKSAITIGNIRNLRLSRLSLAHAHH